MKLLKSLEYYTMASNLCESEIALKGRGKCYFFVIQIIESTCNVLSLFKMIDYESAEENFNRANCINVYDCEIWAYLCIISSKRSNDSRANFCLKQALDTGLKRNCFLMDAICKEMEI